jgi:hypothetical protein
MKNKYITTQILLACQSKPVERKKDIHAQLAETIAERKQIMQQLELIQWKARIIKYLNFSQAA